MMTANVALWLSYKYSRATSEGTLHTTFHQNCLKLTMHMLDYKDTQTECTLKFNTETECDKESIGREAGRLRVMEKGLPMPNINTSLPV